MCSPSRRRTHDDCWRIILCIPHLILILVLEELNNYHPGGASHSSYHNSPSGGGFGLLPPPFIFLLSENVGRQRLLGTRNYALGTKTTTLGGHRGPPHQMCRAWSKFEFFLYALCSMPYAFSNPQSAMRRPSEC